MTNKIWDNVGYIVMALLLIGQVTVGWLFMVGQGAYLIGNILNVVRDFKLGRPRADKVKNIVSDRHLLMQAGNAMTVNVIKLIGRGRNEEL